MKKVLFIIVLSLFLACKSKTVTLEKSKEVEKNNYQKHFDSLVKLLIKNQFEYSKIQSLQNSNFILKSVPVLDSFGNRKPLNYKHYVDGKLAEEIYLEGGELSQTNESKEAKESEHKDELRSENIRIESDVGSKSSSEKATEDKVRKAETKGFQAGFYLWLFAIIIAILVLRWLSNKFKLPDKFSSLFNKKGG